MFALTLLGCSTARHSTAPPTIATPPAIPSWEYKVITKQVFWLNYSKDLNEVATNHWEIFSTQLIKPDNSSAQFWDLSVVLRRPKSP